MALLVRTRARCFLYSGLARRSPAGSRPSDACWAASSGLAPLCSASSTAVALTGVGPTLVRPIRQSPLIFWAATPTIAQSNSRRRIFDHRRVLDRHVAGQRADAQLVPVFVDVVEVLQAVDVDDCRRLRESEPHQRNQAVPTGEHLCVLSIFAEQLGRLLHRGGTCVFECGWNHLLAPFIMCQSLFGVAGMSTCLMPSGLSASQMALITG